MMAYLYAHPYDFGILAILLSYAVRTLPEPPNPPVGFWQSFYFWFHNFTHLVLANADKLRMPGMIPKR